MKFSIVFFHVFWFSLLGLCATSVAWMFLGNLSLAILAIGYAGLSGGSFYLMQDAKKFNQ